VAPPRDRDPGGGRTGRSLIHSLYRITI
jgi:hypothetical protein